MSKNKVIQLFIDKTMPDVENVWRQGDIINATGSATCVEYNNKKYLITNSHCVEYENYIECNLSKRYRLRAKCISFEFDLALLEAEDENIWSEIQALKFGSQIEQGEDVCVLGFPSGGVNHSITKGIISRTMVMLYNDIILNLAVQIDAGVNPGNSGGPAINIKGEIIGMAFAHRHESQNMCFMIPYYIIQHYLNMVEKFKKFPGICMLNVQIISMENKYMQKYYGADHGILITKVYDISGLTHILSVGDVILAIDDVKINSNATVQLQDSEKIPYWHLLRMKSPGDEIKLSILRAGDELNLKITLEPYIHDILPTFNVPTKSFNYGGLIFTVLNHFHATKFPENFGKYIDKIPETLNQEIVILNEIMRTEHNAGYKIFVDRLIKVNDKTINNLQDVAKICNKATKYVKFEFENSNIIILDSRKCLQD